MAQYPGGKNGAGTYQKIINMIPPHRVYIEPFLGSGAIMLKKRPAERNIGTDLDADCVERVRWASWKVLPGGIAFPGDVGREIVARGETEWRDLPAFQFFAMDALDLLNCYPFRGDEFVYCDPPYVRSSRRQPGPLYKHEYTDHDHRMLLAALVKLPCSIAISGYPSSLYDDVLSGWRAVEFQAITRGGTMATERVWMNYPGPARLHDYRYLGDTFRDRERITRKKNRFLGKLNRMDEMERAAILWAIQESGF
jgi:DNA adenine methylase